MLSDHLILLIVILLILLVIYIWRKNTSNNGKSNENFSAATMMQLTSQDQQDSYLTGPPQVDDDYPVYRSNLYFDFPYYALANQPLQSNFNPYNDFYESPFE